MCLWAVLGLQLGIVVKCTATIFFLYGGLLYSEGLKKISINFQHNYEHCTVIPYYIQFIFFSSSLPGR